MSIPSKWMTILLLTVAAVLIPAMFTAEIRDTDVWLHLKTGEHTWKARSLTVPDPFSYTSALPASAGSGEATVRRFNLTSEWLSQVLMFLLYAAGGFPALVAARAGLLAAFCGLAGWLAFRRTGNFYLAIASALGAAGMAYHFQQSRPFLATFVCVALTMTIVESGHRLWLLPPLFLVWSNCHPGFFLGWVVIGAYAAEAMVRRLRKKPVEHERALWLALALSILASAINPNGLRVIQVLSLYRASGIQSENLEWQKPIFWEPGIYSFLLFGALALMLLSWRRTRAADWILYLAFAAISLTAIRNVIFLGLIGPVLMAQYAPKRRAVSIATAGIAAAALVWFDFVPAATAGNVFAFRAAEWQLPTGSADFIQTHRIADRMFNSYEAGGYLVWRLWPLQRDFIDPRGLSEEAFADYRRLLVTTDRAERERILEKYGIGVIVLDGFDYLGGQPYPLVVETARNGGEWNLVQADAHSVTFLRRLPSGIQPLKRLGALMPALEQQCKEHLQHDPLHPRCARGLGELYAFEGNTTRAEEWMRDYLDRAKQADPEAEKIYRSMRVTSLNNAALALEEKGDLRSAEPMLREALTLAETALGPDHPDTAGTLNNLARLLENEGNPEAAEPLYRRALAIAEKVMPSTDPRLAVSLENVAALLDAKGDYPAAEPLYRRALAIAEKSLGPNDQTTRDIREELSALLRKRR